MESYRIQNAYERELERKSAIFHDRSSITVRDLLKLAEYVNGALEIRGDCEDFRYTREWLRAKGYKEEVFPEYLKENGVQSDLDIVENNLLEKLVAPEDYFTAPPISADQLTELKKWLNRELCGRGCDNELTLTKEWLIKNGLPYHPTILLLKDHGGHCDCEVIMNVDSIYFRDEYPDEFDEDDIDDDDDMECEKSASDVGTSTSLESQTKQENATN